MWEATGGGRRRRRRRSPGYRIKNKNPTQRCGEKTVTHLLSCTALTCNRFPTYLFCFTCVPFAGKVVMWDLPARFLFLSSCFEQPQDDTATSRSIAGDCQCLVVFKSPLVFGKFLTANLPKSCLQFQPKSCRLMSAKGSLHVF